MEPTVRYCPKCGAALKPEASFCPQCGAEVSPALPRSSSVHIEPTQSEYIPAQNVQVENRQIPASSQPTAAKRSGRRAPLIIACVAAAALIIGGVTAVILSGRNADSEPQREEEHSSQIKVPAPETTSNADEEYLDCVDQAIQLGLDTLSQLTEKIENRYDYNYPHSSFLVECVTPFTDMQTALSELRSQADEIEGVDTALKDAGDEIFQILEGSSQNGFEVFDFLRIFWERTMDGNQQKPEIGGTYAEYYGSLYQWYQGLQDLSFDCPPALTGEWDQYRDGVALCETVLYKLETGLAYSDSLRLKSAACLAVRSDIMMDRSYESMLSCMTGEINHMLAQLDYARKLADEMREYTSLSEEERDGYSFTQTSGRVRLSYDVTDTIYPSLYSTYDAFLIIRLGCVSGVSDIVVEAEIPGFTQKYKKNFTIDSYYRAIYIKPPALTSDLDLSSAKDAQLTVTISEKDGTLLDTRTFPITIKSLYDVEWYSDEYGVATQDNILCYLTPESKAVNTLKRDAIDEIASMTGNTVQAFPGYQDLGFGPYVMTYIQAAGLMRAMYESGVRYNMDSYSISGSNQHVLLPDDVLEQRSGLCIETSLTVASALQSAGMHTFLIFPPGHAQVAVEVWGTPEHQGEYFLIETTALQESSNNRDIFVNGANALLAGEAPSGPITYMSQDDFEKYLTDENVEYVIDCDDALVLGMTPFSN